MNQSSDDIVSRNKAIEKKRIVDQLREMPIVEVACRRAGVARATYYRWLKKDAEFAKLCREALEHSTSAVSDIAEAARVEDHTAAHTIEVLWQDDFIAGLL